MDTGPTTSVVTDADACCDDSGRAAQPAAAVRPAPNRAALIQRAFRLEYATVAWMVIEATVTIWAALEAASVSLLAFGIDSLIELTSAGVLLWRLTIELHRGETFAEGAERTASRIAGGLLFALAAYVVSAAGWRIWTQTGGTFSWPGLIVTMLAMPVMYVLARRKIAIAEALGSRAMRADAMESVTCGWLSAVVVVGLIVQGLTGAWWVDSLTSLGIVWLLLKEGREAWSEDHCCRD
jgi:divalent metal cation (Fe/Co/Zn/Cd) transporter